MIKAKYRKVWRPVIFVWETIGEAKEVYLFLYLHRLCLEENLRNQKPWLPVEMGIGV